MFIDVHTHLNQYDQAEIPEIIERAREAGVGAIIAAGVTVEGTRDCIALAARHDGVFAGVGVHPSDLSGELDSAAQDDLRAFAACDEVVVMSEIGLDYQDRSPDRAMQERAFRAQIAIAREEQLPVVFHMRYSTEDTLRVLREEGVSEVGGAAHYFQGSWEDAQGVIDLGCYISLAKPLLRLPELQGVAARTPLSSIVLETDCYPQPFKGRRDRWTEPKDVLLVASKLAELKRIGVDEVMEVTTANALEMLGPRAARVTPVLSR